MKTIENKSNYVLRVYDDEHQRNADIKVLKRLGFDHFTTFLQSGSGLHGPALQAGHYRPHYDLRPWDPSQGTRGIRTTPEAIIRQQERQRRYGR